MSCPPPSNLAATLQAISEQEGAWFTVGDTHWEEERDGVPANKSDETSAGGDGYEQKEELRSKNWPVGDILVSIVFIAYSVFMFVGALGFPRHGQMTFVTGPWFTPMLLSSVVVILCMVIIVRTVLKSGRLSLVGWMREVSTDERMRRSLVIAVVIGIYVGLIGVVHFTVVNLVFFLVVFFYLKIGSRIRIVVYSLAGTLLVGHLVPYIFNLPVP